MESQMQMVQEAMARRVIALEEAFNQRLNKALEDCLEDCRAGAARAAAETSAETDKRPQDVDPPGGVEKRFQDLEDNMRAIRKELPLLARVDDVDGKVDAVGDGLDSIRTQTAEDLEEVRQVQADSDADFRRRLADLEQLVKRACGSPAKTVDYDADFRRRLADLEQFAKKSAGSPAKDSELPSVLPADKKSLEKIYDELRQRQQKTGKDLLELARRMDAQVLRVTKERKELEEKLSKDIVGLCTALDAQAERIDRDRKSVEAQRLWDVENARNVRVDMERTVSDLLDDVDRTLQATNLKLSNLDSEQKSSRQQVEDIENAMMLERECRKRLEVVVHNMQKPLQSPRMIPRTPSPTAVCMPSKLCKPVEARTARSRSPIGQMEERERAALAALRESPSSPRDLCLGSRSLKEMAKLSEDRPKFVEVCAPATPEVPSAASLETVCLA